MHPFMDTMTVYAASLALFVGDNVLLIKRARPPFKGFWTLPGGRLEAGETAQQALERELAEELGLVLTRLTEVTCFVPQPGIEICVFAARLDVLPPLTPNAEIADHKLLGADQLVDLPVTPGLNQVLRQALKTVPRS